MDKRDWLLSNSFRVQLAILIFVGIVSATLTAGCYNSEMQWKKLANAVDTDTSSSSATPTKRLVFTSIPNSTATAGMPFSPQPQLSLQNSDGTLIATATDTVTISAYLDSSCSTSVGGGTMRISSSVGNTMPAAAGIATFSMLNYTKAETIYLKASAPGYASACTSSSIAVAPTVASSLSYSTQPSTSAVAGDSFSQSPQIEVLDSFGNLVTGSGGLTIAFAAFLSPTCSTSPGSGTVSTSPTTVTTSSGTATMSSFTYDKVESGTVYFKASTGALTAACSSGTTMSPNLPASIAIVSGENQGGKLNSPLSQNLKARVDDAYGNPVPNVAVTWTVATGPATNYAINDVVNPSDSSGYIEASFKPGLAQGAYGIDVEVNSNTLVRTTFTETGSPGAWAAGKPTTVSGNPTAREGHTAVWDNFNNRMIVWGGFNGAALNTGATFDPVANSWGAIPTTAGPSGRYGHSATWIGNGMLVWGGEDGLSSLNDGSFLDVSTTPTGTWTAMGTAGSPPAKRAGHTAVFIGGKVWYYGGKDGASNYGDGFEYDPATGTWTSFASPSPITPRFNHTAIWTGSEMIVWGGVSSGAPQDDGARYNGSAWTTTPPTGTPAARELHTAIWDGTVMVIWGGIAGATTLNSGGRFNPSTNTWTPVATAGSPGARSRHTAIWAGHAMIVFGGVDSSNSRPTGIGLYDPTANLWTTLTSLTNQPIGRNLHTTVWTGDSMIVWGGFNGTVDVNNGGYYTP